MESPWQEKSHIPAGAKQAEEHRTGRYLMDYQSCTLHIIPFSCREANPTLASLMVRNLFLISNLCLFVTSLYPKAKWHHMYYSSGDGSQVWSEGGSAVFFFYFPFVWVWSPPELCFEQSQTHWSQGVPWFRIQSHESLSLSPWKFRPRLLKGLRISAKLARVPGWQWNKFSLVSFQKFSSPQLQ